MSWGSKHFPWDKLAFEVVAQGSASDAAKVAYLVALLRAKQVQIDTLELKLNANRIDQEVFEHQMNAKFESLLVAEATLREAREKLLKGQKQPLEQPKRRGFRWFKWHKSQKQNLGSER